MEKKGKSSEQMCYTYCCFSPKGGVISIGQAEGLQLETLQVIEEMEKMGEKKDK